MPIDKFFTSAWKSKPKATKIMAAKHRTGWPTGSQFEKILKLEMREKGHGAWFHVMNVPESRTISERSAWEENNPGWEFKVSA